MRKKIDLIILLLVLIGGGLAIRNARAIGDWWHAKIYKPSSEISQLAVDSGMNQTGQKLFYRFSPQLVHQPELDKYCNIEKLGCVKDRSIYILQSSDKQEYNRAIVTASHEMLHVAYNRLSTEERDSLEVLFKLELAKVQAADIIKVLKGYPEEDYYNEAHSFIGSELPNLNSDLEKYYSKYFVDRSKSTKAYANSPEKYIH